MKAPFLSVLDSMDFVNEKLEKLISVGKESRDISLMPSVLVKYDLKGLNNTINDLEISGLDPKKVPLLAY